MPIKTFDTGIEGFILFIFICILFSYLAFITIRDVLKVGRKP